MASSPQNRRWYEQGLNWRGRRKDGVSDWRGTWRNGTPLWFCRLFTGLSVLFAFIGLGAGMATLFGVKALLFLALMMLFETTLFGVITWFMYQQRKRFLKLRDTAGLAEAMGVSQEELERLADERDIKPDVYFNDVPLYDPDKLIAAKILLRPSAEPVANETLLRAAMPSQSTTETEQLLRASTNK